MAAGSLYGRLYGLWPTEKPLHTTKPFHWPTGSAHKRTLTQYVPPPQSPPAHSSHKSFQLLISLGDFWLPRSLQNCDVSNGPRSSRHGCCNVRFWTNSYRPANNTNTSHQTEWRPFDTLRKDRCGGYRRGFCPASVATRGIFTRETDVELRGHW